MHGRSTVRNAPTGIVFLALGERKRVPHGRGLGRRAVDTRRAIDWQASGIVLAKITEASFLAQPGTCLTQALAYSPTAYKGGQSPPFHPSLQFIQLQGACHCSQKLNHASRRVPYRGLSHKNWSPPKPVPPERPRQKSWSPRNIRGRKISPPGTVRGTAHGPPLLSMVPRPKSVSSALPGFSALSSAV